MNSLIKPPTLYHRPLVLRREIRGALDLQRSNFGANEWTCSIEHHWETKLMSIKQITHSATSNTEECTACQSIEEAAHDHGLDVLRHCAGNEPDQEQRKGNNVDFPSAIELSIVSWLCPLCPLAPSNLGINHTSDNGLRKSGPIPNIMSIKTPIPSPTQQRTKTPDEKRQSQRRHFL